MGDLTWNDALVLGIDWMDAVHEEMVAHLAAVAAAPEPELPARWAALVAHTEAHFEGENRVMVASRFGPTHCHLGEHERVLGILRAAAGAVAAGSAEAAVLRRLGTELGTWLERHAETMDTMLAAHLEAMPPAQRDALATYRVDTRALRAGPPHTPP